MTRKRRALLVPATLFVCSLHARVQHAQNPHQPAQDLRIDASGASTPFPHFWEKTFGSGRAILSLRESYRKDLRAVKAATDFQSIRFHGIFLDEVGLYDPDRMLKNPGLAAVKLNENGPYNFSYVDQIYDGLLENHVKPFVELSFMPRKMAADPGMEQAFWYHPVSSPPKDYALWDGMLSAFAMRIMGMR